MPRQFTPRTKTTTVLFLFVIVGTSFAAQCTVCQDGSAVPESLSMKGLGRENSAIPINTCGELETIVGNIGEDLANCQSARAVGTFCGCPIPDTACRLCGEALYVGEERGSLTTTVDAQKYIADSPSTNMTCESVESFLHSLEDGDEGYCAEVKSYASPECCVDAVRVRVTGATEAPAPTVSPAPTTAPAPGSVKESIDEIADVPSETSPANSKNNKYARYTGFVLAAVVTWMIV